MNTVFFGPAEEPLYGVIHEPEGTTMRDFAVLICYPFGQEYMITHRALRTLCTNLARAGVPSMRFDYAGTGDSSGDVFRVADCVQDTLLAVQALREYSGLDTIKVVGLRLGAAIAALASEHTEFITHISLWDPVVNGVDYLNEITHDGTSAIVQGDMLWVDGYAIEMQARKEIEAIDLQQAKLNAVSSLHFILSQPNLKADAMTQSLSASHRSLTVDQSDLDDVNTWIRADYNGAFLLPHKILQRIQQELLRDR